MRVFFLYLELKLRELSLLATCRSFIQRNYFSFSLAVRDVREGELTLQRTTPMFPTINISRHACVSQQASVQHNLYEHCHAVTCM